MTPDTCNVETEGTAHDIQSTREEWNVKRESTKKKQQPRVWDLPKRPPVVKARKGSSLREEERDRVSDVVVDTITVQGHIIQIYGDNTFLILNTGIHIEGAEGVDKWLETKLRLWREGILDIQVTDVLVEHAPSAIEEYGSHRTIGHRRRITKNTMLTFVNNKGEVIEHILLYQEVKMRKKQRQGEW